MESLSKWILNRDYVHDTIGITNATRLNALAAIQMQRAARIMEEGQQINVTIQPLCE